MMAGTGKTNDNSQSIDYLPTRRDKNEEDHHVGPGWRMTGLRSGVARVWVGVGLSPFVAGRTTKERRAHEGRTIRSTRLDLLHSSQ